jgi:SAM-dependent methyltransferase
VAVTAGDWTSADLRYRGYSVRAGEVRFDHRVEVALELLDGSPGKAGAGRALDLGAGDCLISSHLAGRAGGTSFAADLGFPVALAPAAVPVRRVRAEVGQPLPFRTGAFAVVTTLETIEHLLDPDAFLAEIRRVLAPGGVLVLSTPRLDALLVVIALLVGVQPPGVDASLHHRYGSPFGEGRPSGHLHLFTRRALLEALSAHGFRLDAYREGRFSSSWRQAARASGRHRGIADLAAEAFFRLYDLIPFRKDVMVVRATAPPGGPGAGARP